MQVERRRSDVIGRCAIVGRGRAGASFAGALTDVGWTVDLVSSRSLADADLESVGHADLVLVAVADGAIGDVSGRLVELGVDTDGVVAHVSGACGLDVLAGHSRVGSLHPLMSLPDARTGRRRLLDRCTFAVDGDPFVEKVVETLGGRPVRVPSERRALYHATASIAANHVTALCNQIERLSAEVGVPVDAYWRLMSTTLDNVAHTGSEAALTGPASRADWDTVRSHVDALPPDERALYLVLCARAATMAGHDMPTELTVPGTSDPT